MSIEAFYIITLDNVILLIIIKFIVGNDTLIVRMKNFNH